MSSLAGTSHPDLDAALANDPRLQEPIRVENRADRPFSPLDLFALTRTSRHDVDASDEDLFLCEEVIDTVPRDGVVLGGLKYTGTGIIPHVARDGDSRRQHVIRYNRALRARGVLEVIKLGYRDKQGRFQFLATLLRQDFAAEAENALEIVRQREMHTRLLAEKVKQSTTLKMGLDAGNAAVQRLTDSALARARIQQRDRKKAAPFVATPEEGPQALTSGQAKTKRAAQSVARLRAGANPGPDSGDEAATTAVNTVTRSRKDLSMAADSRRPAAGGKASQVTTAVEHPASTADGGKPRGKKAPTVRPAAGRGKHIDSDRSATEASPAASATPSVASRVARLRPNRT